MAELASALQQTKKKERRQEGHILSLQKDAGREKEGREREKLGRLEAERVKAQEKQARLDAERENKKLQRKVVGAEAARDAFTNALSRAHAGQQRPGRPSAQDVLLRDFLNELPPGEAAPAYWRRQLEVEKARVLALEAEVKEKADVIARQEKLMPEGGLMKRTVQDVVCNKTLKKLKSLTYGTRTKQFFIEAAALNLPPVKIQQFVRLLHSVYYPGTHNSRRARTGRPLAESTTRTAL